MGIRILCSQFKRALRVYLSSLFLGVMLSVPVSAEDAAAETVHTLPSELAYSLRNENVGGRAGCPTSRIFVHGFRYLDNRFDQVLFFLGAPDYLCKSNSFVATIVDADGNWSYAKTKNDKENKTVFLTGKPLLFVHSGDARFSIVAEWQVEGPGNSLYLSNNAVDWLQIELPGYEKIGDVSQCCRAPEVHRLCIEDGSKLFVFTRDSADDDRGENAFWSLEFDEALAGNIRWEKTPRIPPAARCDERTVLDFLPASLSEKTEAGAIFEISDEWAVKIPGPTR